MSKWKQVDGDRDFAGTGCTLARANKAARTVELVRITPWLELDSSAMREGYGLWDVSSGYVDYSEMGVDSKTVRSALKTIGMDEDDYRRLGPEHKAAIIMEYSGYSESQSVSDFGEALPAPVGQIEFYRGSGQTADIPAINRSMRREATQKLYGGHPNRVPSEKALTFATGGEPVERELDDEEVQALCYASAVASQSHTWDKPKPVDKQLSIKSMTELQFVLKMLLAAPPSRDLPSEAIGQLAATYARDVELDWEDKDEQVRSMIDEDSENARRLARDILEELGF
jgi:hypothetical protein